MASTDGSAEPTKRDVKNHLLFEIATEVANRGSLRTPCHSRGSEADICSWWNLLGAEVEGPGNYRRVWREILSHWTSQPRICQSSNTRNLGIHALTDIALGCCRSRAPRPHI
jgi:hypothetical protein